MVSMDAHEGNDGRLVTSAVNSFYEGCAYVLSYEASKKKS